MSAGRPSHPPSTDPLPEDDSKVRPRQLTASGARPGDVIGGKYAVIRRIGGGASANVWEAEHRVIGSRVAIKVVHSDLSRRDEMLDRFQQEARICGTIRSAYPPQAYDVGHLDYGVPFMDMELLTGETFVA